jgi:ABC-type nitrate/sulfonate/bicarbonate transport system permease component
MRRHLIFSFIAVIVSAALWEFAARALSWNPLLLPPPSRVLESLFELLMNGQLATDVARSLDHVGVGFLLAVLIGTPLGIFIGMSAGAQTVIDPVVQFLKPIPPIAWIPLAILWFGIGDAPSYFLTFIAAVFPIALNVQFGVRSISPQHFAVARVFGAGRRLLLTQVILPATLPFAMSGYRIGLGVAWMTVVGAEMIAAPNGLGHLIHASQDLLQTDRVIAGMFCIGAIGLAFDWLLRRLETRLVPWKAVGA